MANEASRSWSARTPMRGQRPKAIDSDDYEKLQKAIAKSSDEVSDEITS